MAKAMSASGDWKPKAILVMSLIFVFMDSGPLHPLIRAAPTWRGPSGQDAADAPREEVLAALGCRSHFFLFVLLSCGSYVPAPPAQPSCGRLRSGCLVSALRLFPPTIHPLLALRVAPLRRAQLRDAPPAANNNGENGSWPVT